MTDKKTNAQYQREYKQRMLARGYVRAPSPYIPDCQEARDALKIAVKNICDMYAKKTCISAK